MRLFTVKLQLILSFFHFVVVENNSFQMLVSICNTQLNHSPCHYYCDNAAPFTVKQPLVDLLLYPLKNYPFLYLAIKEKSRKVKSGDSNGRPLYVSTK